jgi:antitoxin component YwqK of YwqJK toxin-antitoxin module
VITSDKIEERGDIYYEAGQATPFTGLVQEIYPNGKKSSEVNYKGGKPHGVYTRWGEGGKKTREIRYENGVWKD